MYDLIYLNDANEYKKAQNIIKEKFPNVIFDDESDFVHHWRFSIELKIDERQYKLSLLEMGLALCSLHFQFFMKMNPVECLQIVEEWKMTTLRQN